MLKFEPFSIESLKNILPYIREGVACSDLSAGALFMWQDGSVYFCERNGTLVVRQNRGEQPAFSYPIGKDPDGMIDELLGYVKENRLPLRFFAVDDETLEKIKSDGRLNPSMWACDRRWSDYVYSFEAAKTFHGRKYDGQRNHINRFKKLYGEPDVRLLTDADLTVVSDLLSEYEAEHVFANALERLELESTKKLLSVYSSLGLYAAGLFVDGKLAAFSIGEISGNTLFIHVEKALKRFEGAYPTMYSGFVNLIDKIAERELLTVNREDDSGDPGIRTSKLQYHPIRKIDKYLVHVGSPASKIRVLPEIKRNGVVLTPFRESDKKAYLALNTDVENNRYWGYDYREDVGITNGIDEDTFYDFTALDMRVGDSINFAVRLASDGEMIGEAILWNFNADGEAELGCRIMPKYQGHGYGKAAFRAAADFAKNDLGLKVYARCFRENTASRKMILASGFEAWYDGENHEYFKFSQKSGGACEK